MLDHETERKNVLLGWGLFLLFVVLFAGSVGVALLYISLD
jgi:hypothetical protein